MKVMTRKNRVIFVFLLMVICMVLSPLIAGASETAKVVGQTVYVPGYSHIVTREGGRAPLGFDLSINLSIRNTDPGHAITITGVDYYNSEGELIKGFLEKPMKLEKMASTYFFIEQTDQSGGWGANFIVEWKSEEKVSAPIIESVNYGSRGSHSVSFVSRGKVIQEKK